MGLVVGLINLICCAFYVVLFLRLLISWFDLSPYSAGARLVLPLTDPMLKPVRRLLTPLQRHLPLDISPVAIFAAIEIVRRVVTWLLMR
jgi:YggT family protein